MMEQPKRYFQHFKGNLYEMLHIAKDSETLQNRVVYRALYGEKGVWVRPEAMFFEAITRDGKTVPRFRELTPEEFETLRTERSE
ncbi:MAG: DUF1653 domain-containing protein [Bacteroidales bacterium]